MATSSRKRRVFRSSPEPEQILTIKKRKNSKKKLQTFKKSPDSHSFSHLAKVLTSGQRIAMLNAVDRLKGRSRVLVELAAFSNFQFVRLAAISNLASDIWDLVEIAKYCQYADTRSAAVDELSANNEALAEVASSSLFKDTRIEAVSIITDPDSLAQVAASSPNRDSRTRALEMISKHNRALKRVAQESSYKTARAEAVKSLKNDAKVLCSLLTSKHADVRKSAASLLSTSVDKLDDATSLTEIAKISPNEDARYLAIGRLSQHPFRLREVVYNSKYRDARSTALMLLSDIVEDIDDPEMLAEVAILSPYEDCRSAAIERINEQSSALLAIAIKSKFKDARDLALDKLKGDVEALKSASKLSRYNDTRKKAHGIVSRPEVFHKELSKILG
ncbi:hypothetical protein KKB44_04750 [Candidatus Micrarchaeota archaeon]|nr:hypothetical protein [Candidatus Micrarchaeota archaeon]